MARSGPIKPTHKAIKQYYRALQSYSDQRVNHEGALETAFQGLLADVARLHHCTLIPKNKLKVGKNTIYPDGTVREALYDNRKRFLTRSLLQPYPNARGGLRLPTARALHHRTGETNGQVSGSWTHCKPDTASKTL